MDSETMSYVTFGLITFAAIMNVLAAWFLHRAHNLTYGEPGPLERLWNWIRWHS